MSYISGDSYVIRLELKIIFKTDLTSQNQMKNGWEIEVRKFINIWFVHLVCYITIVTENLVCIENEKKQNLENGFLLKSSKNKRMFSKMQNYALLGILKIFPRRSQSFQNFVTFCSQILLLFMTLKVWKFLVYSMTLIGWQKGCNGFISYKTIISYDNWG